jgi:DNA-binding protein H-NS
MALKSMSIERLSSLRDKVDATLRAKVAETRRDLEAKLNSLSGVGLGSGRTLPRIGPRGPVAPKYRNPENPSETWAGRGLRPRWLTAAVKSGRKLEEFLINGAPKSATKASKGAKRKPRRKSAKPHKTAARKTKAARPPTKTTAQKSPSPEISA